MLFVELIALLAQSPLPETPAGWAGWATALSSGGVLAWLLFVHLPSRAKADEKFQATKDQQLRELIDGCEKHTQALTKTFLEQSQLQRTDFQTALTYVSQQNERYVSILAEALRSEMKLTRDAGDEQRSGQA